MPTPSTCPETRWPPSRSDMRSAFSRLISPGSASPTVQRSVSLDTSTPKLFRARATTVRHTPFTAMLSPIATSRSGSAPAPTVRRKPPLRRSAFLIRPVAATIPLNICPAPSDPRQDAQVRADTLDLANLQGCGPRQLGDLRQMEHPPARIAYHARRKIDEELVDHARLEERAIQLRSRLDVDLVELPPRELLHQLEQLDLAAVVRDDHDFGPRLLQRGDPLRIVYRADNERLPLLQEARGRRCLEFRIDDDLEGLPGRVDAAHVELRVVVPHRAEAGENRAGARAPAMAVLARGLPGDPLALAVGERSAPVEARRDLHAHPEPPARHTGEKPDVELARLLLHQPLFDRNTRRAQLCKARARDLRIRVLDRRHHALDVRLDDCIDARRCAAVMAAWFEVHVQRCAGRARPGCFQSEYLRVRHSGLFMPARADDRPVSDDDAADAWIGCRRVEAAPGKLERLLHESMVGGREHYFSIRRARLVPGFFTSRIASRKSSTR